MLMIDGAHGEGGGQILRTALSLSMITGQPFAIENIRAGRAKPGLLRQHLTCVEAAAKISSAKVTGAHLGSKALSFAPGEVNGGTYTFAVGTAGSTVLVFQTVLPALLFAREGSTITLSGGTHCLSAPTFDYLDRVFLPILARMGASVETRLERHGFYPAGGGRWQARIAPCARLTPVSFETVQETISRRVHAVVANIPFDAAQREAETARQLLNWPMGSAVASTVKADGPGNVMSIEIEMTSHADMFTAFGARHVSAEAVAEKVVQDVRKYLAAQVPIGPHLADQLLLLMALARGGAFITMTPTQHTYTNIGVIEKFLPVAFLVEELEAKRWRISVKSGKGATHVSL